jgi:hypothetical protein
MDEFQTSGQSEARIAADLRPYLNEGILNTDVFATGDYLQELRVFSVVGELPSDHEETDAPAACQEAFRAKKNYAVVRAQINPETPMFVKLVLFRNLLKTSDFYVKRPSFVVFEVSSRQSLGIFSVQFSENYIMCLTDSDGKHADSVVDMSASSSVLGSISQPADLLLGDLRAYSQVENIPIWHQ